MHRGIRTFFHRGVVLAACAAALACGSGPEEPLELPEPADSAGDAEPFDALTGEDVLQSYEQDGPWLQSPPLEAPEGATRVAAHLELREDAAGARPVLEARGQRDDGSWSEWQPLALEFSEEQFRSGVAELGFLAQAVALRVAAVDAEAIVTLQWTASRAEPVDEQAGLGTLAQPLQADLASIGVISRAQWGAQFNKACNPNAAKHRMSVHHTVTAATTSASGIRSIEYFHVKGRGWCDIGYHFLITQDGRIWEGRRVDRLGGHTKNNNSGNVGMALVGCFQPGACGSIPSPSVPPAVMQNAASKLIGHLSKKYGIPLNRDRVRGHREHSGQTTSCPGDAVLVRLNNILAVAQSGGAPAQPVTPPPPPVGCNEVERLAGADRFGTAALLSKRLFPGGAKVVVLASGEDGSPDALAAGPLARSLGGPLLLSAKASLPFATAKELGRLKPQKVIIVGGAGAISAQVELTVKQSVGTVERISGGSRYETAANVALKMGSRHKLAFIAAGDGALVDAMAAGSPAGALGAPLLLVEAHQLPAATAAALAQLQIDRTVVVGGPSSVSEAVLSQLPNPSRVAGTDRFATAAAMANFARDKGLPTTHVYVTRGDKLADALPVAATGNILLLTGSGALSGPAADFLRANSSRATLLGGSGALSGAVENGTCSTVKHQPKSGPALTSCGAVDRISGTDRYATSAALSQRLFPQGASTVVIASGADGSPDAVAGGPLARSVSGPLLMVSPTSLPASISAELGRLGASHAILLGGTGAISQSVANQLSSLGLSVERISGSNRFDTNARIALRTGSATGLVFVASGEDARLVDALAAGGPAAALGAPVLFATAHGLPFEVHDALATLGANRAIVVGGASSVGPEVVAALNAAGVQTVRVAGSDRHASAAALAYRAVAEGVPATEVFVSRGDHFADATAASVAGRIILLSPSTSLAGPAATFLAFHGSQVTLLGGSGALAPRVEDGACRAMSW